MDNKHGTYCQKCQQSAWRMYGGKWKCVPCGYRPPTSFGMGAKSLYAEDHPEIVENKDNE